MEEGGGADEDEGDEELRIAERAEGRKLDDQYEGKVEKREEAHPFSSDLPTLAVLPPLHLISEAEVRLCTFHRRRRRREAVDAVFLGDGKARSAREVFAGGVGGEDQTMEDWRNLRVGSRFGQCTARKRQRRVKKKEKTAHPA